MIEELPEIARRWCSRHGSDFSVRRRLGTGGTAAVFEVDTPMGIRALKLYTREFSQGPKGQIERTRITQQIALGDHGCPSLVRVYDGGEFEDLLFVIMERAPGEELEPRLGSVPRDRIRLIVDQIARAVLFLRSRDLCHRDIKAANIFATDDFSRVTLLDVSVTRNIHDPIGIGTDHDGQLPIVATARYSPPEYLFRLLEPGPPLWHSLDVYQLGALLHDLIMREPLFQREFSQSTENRYRFAWLVATTEPRVEAPDVDQDLVFLARRALDKNWERRSVLRVDDFLADAAARRRNAMNVLGFSTQSPSSRLVGDTAKNIARVRDVAETLRDAVEQSLRQQGVTANHDFLPSSSDFHKRVQYNWQSSGVGDGPIEITYTVEIGLDLARDIPHFATRVTLLTKGPAGQRQETLELPDVVDQEGAEPILCGQVESALPELAEIVVRPQR